MRIIGIGLSLAAFLGSMVVMSSESRGDFLGVYVGGHADIGVGFEGGNLHLHIHAEEDLDLFGGGTAPAAEYDPDQLVIGVPGPAVGRPAGAQWSFLAPNAGDLVWFLPQSDDPLKPFLGLGAEDLGLGDGWSPITWSFDSISTVAGTSSHFSLWREVFGTVTVLHSSLDPGTDSFLLNAGGHDHANMGFTGEGIFDVTFTVTASSTGVGAVPAGTYSDTATFRFATGSFIPTAVPEPCSLALSFSAFLALGARMMRNRKRLLV